MKMLLVGSGAVGESILRILQSRDPESEWLEKVVVGDYDFDRAQEVCEHLGDSSRFTPQQLNAKNVDEMVKVIKDNGCDFVMDAAAPLVSNNIFDAAYEAGANYASMGTWTVPYDPPVYGIGLENSYSEYMADYNFSRHEDWKKKGNMLVYV